MLLFFFAGTILSGASSWETLPLEHFYIHYQPADARIVQALATQADSIYRDITADLGYAPQPKTSVYLCPTPECFQQKQPSPEKVPEWAVGVAYPGLNRIILRSRLTAVEKTHPYATIRPVEIFKHEFAHIALEQALAAHGGAPRWLSEGFSMYHAKQWTLYGQRTIEEVTLREAFIPLRMLTTAFPSDEHAAQVAYSQSFSVVAFMLNTYGKPVFHKFIKNLREGMDTETALLRSAGVNLTRLELEWQASLKKSYSWLSYLANIGLFWFVLSLLFVLIYLIKRHKVKRLKECWEEDEKMVELPEFRPDSDMENPND